MKIYNSMDLESGFNRSEFIFSLSDSEFTTYMKDNIARVRIATQDSKSVVKFSPSLVPKWEHVDDVVFNGSEYQQTSPPITYIYDATVFRLIASDCRSGNVVQMNYEPGFRFMLRKGCILGLEHLPNYPELLKIAIEEYGFDPSDEWLDYCVTGLRLNLISARYLIGKRIQMGYMPLLPDFTAYQLSHDLYKYRRFLLFELE